MSKGQIHNTTGTICKAKKRACPLEESGHSNSIEAYVEHHVKESGVNGEEVTAMIADGTPPADAVEVAKLGMSGAVSGSFSKVDRKVKKAIKRQRKADIAAVIAEDKKLYNPRGATVKIVRSKIEGDDSTIKIVTADGVETKYKTYSHAHSRNIVANDAKRLVEGYNRMEDYVAKNPSIFVSPSPTNVYNPRNLKVAIAHYADGPLLYVSTGEYGKGKRPEYVQPETYDPQVIQSTVDKMISDYNRKKDQKEDRKKDQKEAS